MSLIRRWIGNILLLLAAISMLTTIGTIGRYWFANPPLPFESAMGRSIGAALFPVTMLIVALLVRGRRTSPPQDDQTTTGDSP